jgi:hypothetical protein
LSAAFTGYRPLALVGVAVLVLVCCVGFAVFFHQPGAKPAATDKPPVAAQTPGATPSGTPARPADSPGGPNQTPATQPTPPAPAVLRLADEAHCLQVAATKSYLAGLVQIPATVIDKGVLRNVPYKSYRAGDYEVNVYGDPGLPVGVEIGVYHNLLKGQNDRYAAKKNCIDFVASILSDAADKKLLVTLNLTKDTAIYDGLTVEVTPETAEDSYGGWWVSAYQVNALDLARASDVELQQIVVQRKEVQTNPANVGEWNANDLTFARPVPTPTPPLPSLVTTPPGPPAVRRPCLRPRLRPEGRNLCACLHPQALTRGAAVPNGRHRTCT